MGLPLALVISFNVPVLLRVCDASSDPPPSDPGVPGVLAFLLIDQGRAPTASGEPQSPVPDPLSSFLSHPKAGRARRALPGVGWAPSQDERAERVTRVVRRGAAAFRSAFDGVPPCEIAQPEPTVDR